MFVSFVGSPNYTSNVFDLNLEHMPAVKMLCVPTKDTNPVVDLLLPTVILHPSNLLINALGIQYCAWV